jgi:alpha-L-rhamnosidase
MKFKIQLSVFWLMVVFLSLAALTGCMNSTGRHKPAGLMTDLLLHPEEAVITNNKPFFSWIIEDNRQGAKQTAWQIMVASTRKDILRGKADIWDSGKTPSDQSISIPYNGEPLEPFKAYWWKVRTWDQDGRPGKWSAVQGFNTGDFNRDDLKWPGESRWVQLQTSEGTDYVYENRHPIRYQEVAPVSIVKNMAGNHFISFDKAAFGALRLTLRDPRKADTITVHLGEKKTPEHQVDRRPGGSITYRRLMVAVEPGKTEYLVEIPRFYSNYPNSQVLAEHMPEVVAFRYAEIEGWPHDLDADHVRQQALLYHFDDAASDFRSSDEKLNQIWELCKHTLKVTPFMGIYIDGGARERMPYEADAYVQQISHYSVDREYAIQRYTNDFMIFNPSWPTEWHLHIVLMAWADYMATGNADFLVKYYDELKKKAMLPLAREDGLISTRTGGVTEDFLRSIHYHGKDFRDIVDWPQGTPANETVLRSGHGSVTLAGETDRFVFSDINTVVNAFHYRNLVLLGKIAGLLGIADDEAFFKERSALVRSSFNEKLLDKQTGLYTDGEGIDHSAFHSNMFPVAFGLVPENNYPRILDFLISKGMACSPYGTPYLFDALYEMGAEEYAFELLTSETDRSWMNMIRFGTTITSEAWDLKYKRNMTWNHAWGAAPVYIITRRIFGIEPLEPAFRRVRIKPQPGALESAEIKSPTIRGPVYAKFKNEPGSFTLEVVIPANTDAELMLPAKRIKTTGRENLIVTVNGNEVPFRMEDGFAVIDDLQAGSYKVELTYNR